PQLAMMLAEEASQSEVGVFSEFRFETEEEWREFHIGAWLHDCGKVITPEYVVDKATKLETIYNRIHEIRTRFEILLRDADIERLTKTLSGVDADAAQKAFEARKEALIEDFSFVASSNLGAEFMHAEDIGRLKQIAKNTWLRNFDDRLGLAHDELGRYSTEAAPLPVRENLLDDKPHHILERQGGIHQMYEEFGFLLNIPEHLHNFGELTNLSIQRGTLSEEERFIVNQHIMQTIAMLERLPFPKHLQRVPEYAGTHHEALNGKGYPRKLKKEDLSVPARIMAIADIFEALTASDRPYKKPKTLSESVRILSFFKKDGHIDPDLFDLFLTSGAYKRYADEFLDPSQIDEVDIGSYLN
ncbi:MAG: HD domain-containing protein, partial [Alphaproteobacteria bacterium]|nr:HD domain-containing protein [Alphaproteobacteria bacterium]